MRDEEKATTQAVIASEAKQSPSRKEEIASSQKTLLAMTRAEQLQEKTEEQLINELAGLRQLVAELETTDMERRQAEEGLKELLGKIERAKQEWETTADSLLELVCLVDYQGRIIRANRTVETWNLGQIEKVRGQKLHELVHPDCANSSCPLESIWKQAWEEVRQGQPAQYEVYDKVLKRHIQVRIQPWRGWEKGMTNGSTVVVVEDITKRKLAEEALKEYSGRLEEMVEERTKQLQEAQERLLHAERLATIGQLGASVSHELRNPLGIIKNSAYYLTMKLGYADEKVKKHLTIIENEIARANKIISDLLSFARDTKLALQMSHINTMVQDALSRTPMPDTVAVITELGQDLPPLMTDPDQIQQVFINLILNAAQAMPNGGKLEIATKAEDGFIVAEFKDNGCGIPEEDLGKLFEPLFTTKTKGIGLGLAVSKRIIEAHEGRIEVESEVGKGTTFRVKLPMLGG